MAGVPPRILARHGAQVYVLPPRVALFRVRALLMAWQRRDRFAMEAAARPLDVAELLDLARGRTRVAELGTATGWTAAALVLGDAKRRVVSYDPVVQANRERYLTLLPASARRRIQIFQCTGEEGAKDAGEQDLVFIDSTHERHDTVREIAAWTPKLVSGGLLVLHDFTNPFYPGVAAAVRDMGLGGNVRGGMFVWSKP